jgi:hypothetical protein
MTHVLQLPSMPVPKEAPSFKHGNIYICQHVCPDVIHALEDIRTKQLAAIYKL